MFSEQLLSESSAETELLSREGDTNHSGLREQWNEQRSFNSQRILKRDESVFMKQAMSTPCLEAISDVEGCYITDMSGKRYLDFHGNSLHQVGYKHPEVISAVIQQAQQLPFIPRRFTADVVTQASASLIERTTSKDFRLLFTPSGSAAVGLALKVARKITGSQKVISLWESFHGAGLDTIAVGGEYVFKKDMGVMQPGSVKVMPYNAYRNHFNTNDPEMVATLCLNYLEYVIEQEGQIGAILLEPIRATDTHIPPVSYFKRLREICDKHGILLIFDEIPTSLMRSGEFYVYQNFGIEPDILVLGKGLGGAVIPQAAVLVKSQYDQAEDISLGHYTHEKPALGCAAIQATINVIESENLRENCHYQSAFVKEQLLALSKRFSCIGDIRVQGLLISIELVKDRETKKRATELAEQVMYQCLNDGLSFKLSSGSCITWHPPLIVTRKQLEFALFTLEKALFKFAS